jgi:predicted O-methyltransferase YrrM
MNWIDLAKSRSDCAPQNIDTLVRIVNELRDVPGDILEVGAYRCGATIALANADPAKEVYAFDLFGGLPYGNVGFENFADADLQEIGLTVLPFENIHLIRGLHETIIPIFPARPVSMIFMDSDHYSSHKVALEHFWPRLSSKGIAVFHDWSFPSVQKAIQETIPSSEQASTGTFPDSQNMGFIVKIGNYILDFRRSAW